MHTNNITMFSLRFSVIKSSRLSINNFQKRLNNTQLCKNLSSLTIKKSSESHLLINETQKNKWSKNNIALYSTEELTRPVDPDVFGDLSGNEHEKMELDDEEKELEKFEMEETRVPRRFKPSSGGYADFISDHIAKGDLHSAMNVLQLVKENRDKPTTYMYNLLIRGYAVQGNLKKCWKLYNDMKKRGLKQNAATYTSILNACANSSHKEMAIEILEKVRNELIVKSIPPNTTHYNVMIKAYGRHNYLLEAFQLVDEMVDKRLSTDEATFNSLLCTSISDKSNGLRHALIVWYLMHQRKIKPSVLTYNLLLRAIRDTKFGDLKLNDYLLPDYPSSQIILSDSTTSNLLDRTPTITHLALASMNLLPTTIENESQKYKSSSAASVAKIEEMSIEKSSPIEIDLNAIHEKSKLVLFGGYTGFIERMERDNVKPTEATLHLLMEVSPHSLSIENDLIKIARTKKIPLTIDFFNMLIKRRSARRDYKQAREVLGEIQLHGLSPDIITWGVLAMGCTTRAEGQTLIEGMGATGHALNTIVATTLLKNACFYNHFVYVLDIMNLMCKERIKPSEVTYKVLDEFQRKVSDIVLKKVKSKHSKDPRYPELFSKFKLRYASFRQQFGRENYNYTKTNNR